MERKGSWTGQGTVYGSRRKRERERKFWGTGEKKRFVKIRKDEFLNPRRLLREPELLVAALSVALFSASLLSRLCKISVFFISASSTHFFVWRMKMWLWMASPV